MNRIVKYIKYKYHLGSTFLTQKFEVVPEPIKYSFGIASTVVPNCYVEQFPDLFKDLQQKFHNVKVF